MNPQPAGIQLPGWYACLCDDATQAEPIGRRAGGVTIGRVTVFHPESGCEVARFGPAGESVVLYDGYLFDRDALGRELACPPTAAVPALVATAYERWGAGLFERLDGAYLIAVWDAVSGRLLIGHDALGRHPAFYASEGGTLWFGSNVLALADSGYVRRKLNRLSIALGLLAFWPEAGETHFDGIRRVRPGHYLDARNGDAAHEHRYWEPMPGDEEPWLPDDLVHETFESELVEAVERRMALGVQGIMLSGGVDSVTVAALAARHTVERSLPPLVAVSARTGYGLSHEERMQSSVSDALRMPLVVSSTPEWLDGHDPIALSLDASSRLASPTGIWWVGTYTRFYRRTAEQGLTVLLTGAGGDNWLGVADAYAADLIRGFRVRALARFMKSDIGTGGASFTSSARRLLWAGGMRPLVSSAWARMAPAQKARYHHRKWLERIPGWLCPDPTLKQELVANLLGRRTPDRPASGAATNGYYRHSLRTLHNPYLHHENETAYFIETGCGLRLLSPYHDRRLVSFLNRISPDTLLHGSRYKGLLRPVVAKHLPNLGLEKQRKDYPKQEQDQKLANLRTSMGLAWREDAFDALAELGVVEAPALAREAATCSRMDFDGLGRVFAAMSADRWVRNRVSG